MGRAPCCDKMGLKRGPWTAEEDQILISYIQQHGHANWRALPKQAGLLRCGKSCRLRWMNYLRPDIKRGNFSAEEEDNIVKLHEMLGNRWSAIAARLPGRTDNEIKNVWHTHLKKRLNNYQTTSKSKGQVVKAPKCDSNVSNISPEDSSSEELSSVTDLTSFPNNVGVKDEQMVSSEIFAEIDESFWSEELSTDNSNVQSDFLGLNPDLQFRLPLSPGMTNTAFTTTIEGQAKEFSSNIDDGMDFWYNLLIRAGGLPELPEF